MFKVPIITVDSSFRSVFSSQTFPEELRGQMLLTPRIDAQNLRLRKSEPGYKADWHVAGDPTLIVIQNGSIRITFQDNSYQDFKEGDLFVAQDYLPDHITFDCSVHGHMAEVIGEDTLLAVHIKLKNRLT